MAERTRRDHERMDLDGKIIAERHVRRCDTSNSILNHGASEREETPAPSSSAPIPSRSQVWRDLHGPLFHRAMTGIDVPGDGVQNEDNAGGLHDDNHGEAHMPMMYGPFTSTKQSLSLDMAMYRETWALQAVLDEAKVPVGVQDKVLQMLYGRASPLAVPKNSPEDMSGLCIGELLRHAGEKWDGGEVGLQALSSIKGLTDSFEAFGMPKLERWRVCIGSAGKWHTAEVFPPSDQDNYSVSTGVKCICDNVKKRKLRRDCSICSQRCCWDECRTMRKDMIRFDYLPIGPVLKKICSSRSGCHELLQMWRDKGRWLRRGLSPSTEYKEWWDGSKAAEFAWFWDSEAEFELPVLCRDCFRCYGTIPELCPELQDPDNWDETHNEYRFQCDVCGSRVCSPRRKAKVTTPCFYSNLRTSSMSWIGRLPSCLKAGLEGSNSQ